MKHTKQRWTFTDAELAAPQGCAADDEFLVTVEGSEIPVIVYRNGEASNRFADGTIGVPVEWKELAEAEDTLYDPDTDEYADAWRDVIATELGSFVRFAAPESDTEGTPTPVGALKPGDMVDLEGDLYADPKANDPTFEYELITVTGAEKETPDCVRVDFEFADSVGFPTDHCLRVVAHDASYDK